MNKLTKYEWQLISLFLFALLINGTMIRMKIMTMIVFYIVGTIFEFATEPLWDYNPELKKSPLTLKNRDINFLFGLGWLAIVILGLSLGEYLQKWISNPALCGITGIVIIGNILESLFYYFGLWKYDTSQPALRFPLFIGKYIEIAKIPLSVRVGYIVLGAGIFYLNQFVTQYL